MKDEPQVQWDGVVKDLGRRRFVKAEHWLIRYWLNGKTVSHKIAATEHLSVTHARQIASQMKLMAKHGIDPRPWMQERVRECLGLDGKPAKQVTIVFSTEWDEIDFDEQVWNIPAEKMKAGKPHHVPLVPGAMAVLKRRHRRRKSDKWVFPSEWSKSGHLNCISRAWYRLLRKTGIPNARLHDHRRTLASWEVLTGADIAVVGKMLGHSDLRSTQIYARLNLEPVRAAMIRATDAMFDNNEPSSHRRSFRLVRSL